MVSVVVVLYVAGSVKVAVVLVGEP